MAVAGNTPTDSFLTKVGKMQSAGCQLCRVAREAQDESSDGLAAETHGHISSAGCEGMATTVTARLSSNPCTAQGGVDAYTTPPGSDIGQSTLC